MKRPDPETTGAMEEALCLGLVRGEIDVREATRQMRRILGMSQKEYAKRIVGVSPRILAEFETGKGNPTLSTLEKIAAPFGMRVTFQPPASWQGLSRRARSAAEPAPKRKRPPQDGRLRGRW